MTDKIAAIILAAGKGTRMKSDLPKVLHQAAGLPLVSYPLSICKTLKISPVVLVVAKEHAQIKESLKNEKITFAVQHPPLGTADAVKSGLKKLTNFEGDVLILSGDVPLIQPETIRALFDEHKRSKASLTITTVKLNSPPPYGRIMRDHRGNITKIVEARDATVEQLKVREVNVGLYIAQAQFLKNIIPLIGAHNDQKEFYLTDMVTFAASNQLPVSSIILLDEIEGLGVNSQTDLLTVQSHLFKRKIQSLATQGVRFMNPEGCTIDWNVSIGSNSIIYGPCYLFGATSIGKNCQVEPGVFIKDSTIKDGVSLKAYSYITESLVSNDAQIGPFAHLRPGSKIGEKAKVGNFSEIKKSTIGKGSKVNHLSYIGDATLGKNVNIGAGTITCNYDGVHKFQTILEDGVFVGSDTQFVAPVKVGKDAYIGAGSTITKNVKPKSLALSRTVQTEIRNWKKKKPASKN